MWGNQASFVALEEKRKADENSGIQAKTFRLAEILGLGRSELKAIAAEEYASFGDAKKSLLLCLDLQDKSICDNGASTLANVAQLLTERNSFVRETKGKSRNIEVVRHIFLNFKLQTEK